MLDIREHHTVFGPDTLITMCTAIHNARDQRPTVDIQVIASRVLAAAGSGVYDVNELTRAGVGDD